MKDAVKISRSEWHTFLLGLSERNAVYAPVKINNYIDYRLFTDTVEEVEYNTAKPVTPLKTFFLPVKENLVIEKKYYNKRIIIGVPACDLKALDLLDKIYLDPVFLDDSYKENREKSVLIATDCFTTAEHCHCTTYGIDPSPDRFADAILQALDEHMLITICTPKGEDIFNRLGEVCRIEEITESDRKRVLAKRNSVKKALDEKNRLLPDYRKTGQLIKDSKDDIWEKHGRPCVSCGACATSCPTCTCFLLIDRPGFEKVRQVDACQYPGFARIAAGEDPLRKKFVRFRNRYLCKYVWKPEDFDAYACTGCGRCIDSCIGNINKNKIFLEMMET
jgi:sulfhydrogenase subunit beta (sulfur reductase)